ncbi:hypothetical protein [Paenirhodobacter populi]|uniref:hypothetical protein n=1 Tax=Paenirhodobacter populi TaxID=2306993 RepID=UPI0013E316B9|nr:hypothetical protein [Sinirhodobacter populi]
MAQPKRLKNCVIKPGGARKIAHPDRDVTEHETTLSLDLVAKILKHATVADRNVNLSAESWTMKAAHLGLTVLPGLRFTLDAARSPEAFRLGFASLDDAELARAVALKQAEP